VIVHEVVKFPLQHFLSGHSLGVQAGGVGQPLIWADGIVFEKDVFRDTDEIIKEKLEGKIHWIALNYAMLEKYQPEFKVEGNIRIPVVNVSDNVVFKVMAKWIKDTFERVSSHQDAPPCASQPNRAVEQPLQTVFHSLNPSPPLSIYDAALFLLKLH